MSVRRPGVGCHRVCGSQRGFPHKSICARTYVGVVPTTVPEASEESVGRRVGGGCGGGGRRTRGCPALTADNINSCEIRARTFIPGADINFSLFAAGTCLENFYVCYFSETGSLRKTEPLLIADLSTEHYAVLERISRVE
jgi:hypothetical protein